MKSMAVTKPDMALLSQEELTQATFGALCQSFAMQILDRGGYQDGMYQRVALEFLEEESEQTQQPVQNVFNIDLNVVLETIRKEAQEHKREKKETEKLLEKVLRIQQAAEQKQTPSQQTSQAERTYLLAPQHTTITRPSITVHNSFHQHGPAVQSSAETRQLRQAANRAEREVRAQTELPTVQTRPIPGGPGSLSSRTTQFVKQVQEGQDLTQPGMVQAQQVIPGKKIEENPALRQALRPAAEMELKAEPAQTPETGKTAAEAMKTAVERQLQQMQPKLMTAQTSKQRQPEQQELRQQSQPMAQQKQGQLITTQTIGQEAQQSQSVTHIQQQEQRTAGEPAKQAMLQNKSEIEHQPRTQNRLAAASDKETSMTAARQIPLTGQQTEDRLPQRELVSAHSQSGQSAEVTKAPQQTAEKKPDGYQVPAAAQPPQTIQEIQPGLPRQTALPQTVPMEVRESLAQTVRQDIRITGSSSEHTDVQDMSGRSVPFSPARSMEDLTFRQETEEQAAPQLQKIGGSEDRSRTAEQKQSLPQVLSEGKTNETPTSVTVQQFRNDNFKQSRTVIQNLTEADLQFLSEHQRTQIVEAMKQGTQPMEPASQRDIRVIESVPMPAVKQEQAAAPTIFPPAGSMEELAFRQEAEAQVSAAVQPQRSEPTKHSVPHHTTVQNLTKADLQFLSEHQRTQIVEEMKQGTQPMEPVSQRDIRVIESAPVPAVKQAQSVAPTIFPPAGSMEELAFRQEAEAQVTAAIQPQRSEPTKNSVLHHTTVQNLTKADLQFLSEHQRTQIVEEMKQGMQPMEPVSQRDIRVTGSASESAAVQEQSAVLTVFPPAGSMEELAFRQEAEAQVSAAVQPQRSEPTKHSVLHHTTVQNLTKADLQFLSEHQRTQIVEEMKQGTQPMEPVSGRDIRVTESVPMPAVKQVQSVAPTVFLPAGSMEELAFRQETEEQSPVLSEKTKTTAVQPQRSEPTMHSIPKHTTVQNLTEADLQFLSERQRTQVLEAMKQRVQPMEPVSQRDMRVTGSSSESVVAQVQSAAPFVLPPVGSPEELTFRQETDAQEHVNTQSPAAAAQPQQPQTSRPLSPAYTNLLQTFAPNLTEADLRFLSERQRTQVLEAMKQGAQPVGQRDIRVTGAGSEPVVVQEQPNVPTVFPSVGSPEELAFRQAPEAQEGIKTQSPAAAAQPQQSQKSRPLAPEYTNLLRTFAQSLTEADLQFLSDGQRAQVQEAIKQGAQPVGQRDIRVGGSGLETAALQEQSAVPTAALPVGGMEELEFRQEATVPTAPAVQEAVRVAQEARKPDENVWQTKQPHSAGRDIRVLTERGINQPTVQETETPFGIPVPNLTAADLEFLTQSQPQMMQEAAMEDLHHRQTQPEEKAVVKAAEPISRVQQQTHIRSVPSDIRVLRQLGTAYSLGPQTGKAQIVVKENRYPEPVAMELPTGSDAGQEVSVQPGQIPENVSKSPVELTYSPAMVLQQHQPPKDPTAQAVAPGTDSSYVSSLPQWAQNFVRNGSPTPAGITPTAPIPGVARDISSLPGTIGGDSQTMDWSAPNQSQLTGQAAQRPAEVVFKEKNREEDRKSRSVQMSESELRRTADKIYQIIEDRIRRERRLLGL